MFTKCFFWKFYAKRSKSYNFVREKSDMLFNKFKVQTKFLSVSTIKVK